MKIIAFLPSIIKLGSEVVTRLRSKTPRNGNVMKTIGGTLLAGAGTSYSMEHGADIKQIVHIIEAVTALVGAITLLIGQMQTVKE